MGSQIFASSCTNECDGCKGENFCARGGCGNLCMVQKEQKAVMKTMTLAVEQGLTGGPEKYASYGTDEKQVNACFGVSAHEEVLYDEGTPNCQGRHDEVLQSLPRQPRGTDTANIGSRRSLEELQDECRFNAGKLQKIKQLARKYQEWRPVRGDGNCFYRTVIFGSIEAVLASGDQQRLARIIARLQEVTYASPVDRAAHGQMLQIMQTWHSPEQAEQWVSEDSRFDEALVRASRKLVRNFLLQRAHEKTPAGLTYQQLASALDSSYASMEDFCRLVVDPMGRDAETLALDALPHQLGIGVRMWILDRRDGVDLVSLDTPGPEGEINVHVLFKPGHYDLLYPVEAIMSEDFSSPSKAMAGGKWPLEVVRSGL